MQVEKKNTDQHSALWLQLFVNKLITWLLYLLLNLLFIVRLCYLLICLQRAVHLNYTLQYINILREKFKPVLQLNFAYINLLGVKVAVMR